MKRVYTDKYEPVRRFLFVAWVFSFFLIPVMGQHKDAFRSIYTNLAGYSESVFIVDKVVHQNDDTGFRGPSGESKNYLIGSIKGKNNLTFDDDKTYSRMEFIEKYPKGLEILVLYNLDMKSWTAGHTTQVIPYNDYPRAKYERLIRLYTILSYGPLFIFTVMLFWMKYAYEKYLPHK